MESWKLALISLGVFFVVSVSIITVYFLYYYKNKRRSCATAVEIDTHKPTAHVDNSSSEATTPYANGVDECIDLEKQVKPSTKNGNKHQRQTKNHITTTHINDDTHPKLVQGQETSSPAASAPNTPTPSMKIQHQKELYGGTQQQQEHLQHKQILLQHHHEHYHQLSTSLSPPRSNTKPGTTSALQTANNKEERMPPPSDSIRNSSVTIRQPLQQQKLRVFSLSPDNTNIPETIAIASPNVTAQNEVDGGDLEEEEGAATDRQSVYSNYRQSRALSSGSVSPYYALHHFIARHAATPPPPPVSSNGAMTGHDEMDVVVDWRGPTPPWTQYATPPPPSPFHP